MKIAFISYEYPPDTAFGGIGTYVGQVTEMLQKRDHHIEVFTSSLYRSGSKIENGILVHRIQEEIRQNFPKRIASVFADRHTRVKFDVLEGPEFNAEAKEAISLCPEVPLVIKFHTPTFLVNELKSSYQQVSILDKLRFYSGAFRRRIKPVEYWKYHLENDIERVHALQADELVMPSRAIGDRLIGFWGLDPAKVSYVPCPYIPSIDLINIPINTNTGTVTFIGRLAIGKGVIDLAQAIPLVLQKYPQAKFRFVGNSGESPKRNLHMQQYLEQMLKQYLASVQFSGFVPLENIPSVLADTDVCVFPSFWESFGLVCAEAMAAGRAIVASNAGGMAELLDYGKFGKLVPPLSPEDIAEAIVELLGNPALRMSLGQAARSRLLTEYSADKIGALQEASYERAIQRKQVLVSKFSKLQQ